MPGKFYNLSQKVPRSSYYAKNSQEEPLRERASGAQAMTQLLGNVNIVRRSHARISESRVSGARPLR